MSQEVSSKKCRNSHFKFLSNTKKKNIFHFVHFYIDLALRCYCYCGTYSTIFMVLKHEIWKKEIGYFQQKWILNAVVLSFLAAIKNILLGSEKNVKFCLCWWPDTSVPKACLSLSMVCQWCHHLFISLAQWDWTQLALPELSQSRRV